MAAFRIRYKEWVHRPELNVAEGPFFDVYAQEETRHIRCIHVLLGSSDIQSLKHQMGLQGPQGDDKLQRVVTRYAIKRIQDGLRADIFPNPPSIKTDDLFIKQDEYPMLRHMLQEKTCEYQNKEGRDLLCTATGAGDMTAHSHREFQWVAPTTQALCRECSLPDTDYLCSHFTHPDVRGFQDRGVIKVRQLIGGLCNIGRSEADLHSERCHAGGHECWEHFIEFVQPVPATSAPTLPEAIVARIFLCHASEDKAKVREVYHQLKALGFTPWLDEIDILPGQNWNYEIEQALENSDFVIVFLSTRSVKKIGYVQREFKRALEYSEDMPEGFIHTIPVKLDDCAAPRQFRHHQWVKLYEEGAFDRVVAAIRHGLQQRNQPMPQPEDGSADQRNVYDEQEILALIPYSLTNAINNRKFERSSGTFSFVQDNYTTHKYTRRELDTMAPSQRERLFTAAPEMRAWWRGKSITNGAWPLFRVKGGIWLSKDQIGKIPAEHGDAAWEIPGLLEWYMEDEVF
jgi:hypothetical protein